MPSSVATLPRSRSPPARIIVLAAAGRNNCQIARHLGRAVATVRRWRQRWLALQGVARAALGMEERLSDAPRPGRPADMTTEQVGPIVALSGEAPSQSGRPISQWRNRAIAAAILRRGMRPAISPRPAARRVTRGTGSRTGCAPGSPRRRMLSTWRPRWVRSAPGTARRPHWPPRGNAS